MRSDRLTKGSDMRYYDSMSAPVSFGRRKKTGGKGFGTMETSEDRDKQGAAPRRLVIELLSIAAGTLLFSFAMNRMIVPLGMVNGGFLGLSQLLRIFIERLFPAVALRGDLAGVIYFIMNVPLVFLIGLKMGKRFFIKTVYCIVCYSLFLAVVPVADSALLPDRLSACLVGGVLCAVGIALTLNAGCSGGGEELIGLLCLRKNPAFSVGRITMGINVLVFGLGFLAFDGERVLYSIVFAAVTYLCLDRLHRQNIMVQMLIVTKKPDMEKLIFSCVRRGATRWTGEGAYSGDGAFILLTVVSKKEAAMLKRALKQADPDVFAVCCENISVFGNFKKRI